MMYGKCINEDGTISTGNQFFNDFFWVKNELVFLMRFIYYQTSSVTNC